VVKKEANMTHRLLGAESSAAKEKIDQYSARIYNPYQFVAHAAVGAWLYDKEGNKVLDLLSAYSSILIGHNWKVPIRALQKEYERACVGHCSRVVYTTQYADFVEKLRAMTGFDRVLPASDGRSSTEPFVDVCMMHAHHRGIEYPEVILFEDYFHGRARTFSTNALFDQSQSLGKGPRVAGIVVAEHDVEDVRSRINENTVGIFMEIHRGEGGPLFDDGTYMKVHELARERGVYIGTDGIQDSLYRCGYFMSWQEFGEKYRPDATVLGKALGGGEIPVSALVGTEEFMSVLTPGTHGSTFGGYPRGCVAASATLDYLHDHPEVGERAMEIGARFAKNLAGIPGVEVTHRGALIAVAVDGIPLAWPLCDEMICGWRQPNVLVKSGHRHDGYEYLRLSPPTCIKNEEIDSACFNTIRPILELRKEIVGSGC